MARFLLVLVLALIGVMIYSATTGVGANQVIDTIGYHSVLDTVITRTGGAYYVQLAVTNRNDGIRQFFRTMVTVVMIVPPLLRS